jgi:hypothetical protein
MEGDYDPTHARFLHSTFMPANETFGMAQGTYYRSPSNRGWNNTNPDEPYPKVIGDRRVTERNAPYPDLEDYNAAVLSVSKLEQGDGNVTASVGVTWWMPVFCTAGNAMPGHLSSNMRVPIDNESVMFYRLRWSWNPISDGDLAEYKHGGWTHPEMLPGTWKTKDNVFNDYNLDRLAQRNMSYTGIKTFPLQDIAMMENQWGPIAKRHKEHLATSDYQIIHIRRRLLRAAKNLMQGQEPEEPWKPEIYHMHRETATARTADEAIARAKEAAQVDLLVQREESAQTVAGS